MDSPHWDWFRGYCRLHPGGDLPCRVCLETGTFDVTIERSDGSVEHLGPVENKTVSDGINQMVDIEPAPAQIIWPAADDFIRIPFPPVKLKAGDTLSVRYTMESGNLPDRLSAAAEIQRRKFTEAGLDPDELMSLIGADEIVNPAPIVAEMRCDPGFVPADYTIVSHFADSDAADELRQSLMSEIKKWGEDEVIAKLEQAGYDADFIESLKSNR